MIVKCLPHFDVGQSYGVGYRALANPHESSPCRQFLLLTPAFIYQKSCFYSHSRNHFRKSHSYSHK